MASFEQPTIFEVCHDIRVGFIHLFFCQQCHRAETVKVSQLGAGDDSDVQEAVEEGGVTCGRSEELGIDFVFGGALFAPEISGYLHGLLVCYYFF